MEKLPGKQDVGFSQLTPPYLYQRDDVTLVDLVKMLIRRWKLMAAIFIVIAVAGLTLAFAMPLKYVYSSIYKAAEVSVDKPLEATGSLQSKITNIYMPELIRAQLQQQNLKKLPFEVNVDSPKGTNLIKLTSKAKENDQALVALLHASIIKQLQAEQDSIINKNITILQQQLNDTKQQYESIKDSSSIRAGELAVELMATVSKLELKINNYSSGSLASEATQSLKPKSTSRLILIVFSIIFAGILAVISVFFAEFIRKVRESF